MTPRLNAFLLALLLFVFGPAYWLLIDRSPFGIAPANLDLASARRLATSLPGPRPANVRFITAGCRGVQANLFAAGSGIRKRDACIIAYRLDRPGLGPVMIDTGTTVAGAKGISFPFDAAGQATIDASLRSADLILATDEHAEHLGGLAALARSSEGLAALSHAKLNRWQMPGNSGSNATIWDTSFAVRPDDALDGQGMRAVAPGIVVIPAPGHSPGSQLIYALLADGREVLFTGDTAPADISWRDVRPRPRLVSGYSMKEDRIAIIAWLKAIRAAAIANRRLMILPGHDLVWLTDVTNGPKVARITPVSTP